jgi:hypothetical protein
MARKVGQTSPAGEALPLRAQGGAPLREALNYRSVARMGVDAMRFGYDRGAGPCLPGARIDETRLYNGPLPLLRPAAPGIRIDGIAHVRVAFKQIRKRLRRDRRI